MDAPIPLTQQQLDFLEDKAVGYLSAPILIKINGNLDISALEKSFQNVIDRHQAMCFFYTNTCGEWQQLSKNTIEVKLRRVLLSEQEKQLLRETFLTIKEPFIPHNTYLQHPGIQYLTDKLDNEINICEPPLWTANLIKIDQAFSLLYIQIHFLISDGISAKILFSELCRNYRNSIQKNFIRYGHTHSFKKFSLNEVDIIKSENFKSDENNLKKQLKEAQPYLPYINSPENINSYTDIYIDIPSSLISELSELAQKQAMSLFNILLCAYQLMLHSLLNCRYVLVWSPAARRFNSEDIETIGCLMQKVCVVTELAANPTDIDFLTYSRKNWQQTYAKFGTHPMRSSVIKKSLGKGHLSFAINYLRGFSISKTVHSSDTACQFTQIASKHNKEKNDVSLLLWELNGNCRAFFTISDRMQQSYKLTKDDFINFYTTILQRLSRLA